MSNFPTQPNPTTASPKTAHSIFVKVLAELAGVAVLAIIADMNETLGNIALTLMLGWLLVFLMTNDSFLKGVSGKL